MKSLVLGLLAVSAAALPQLAAAQTTYSTRANFITGAGAVSTETFSGCGTSTVAVTGSISSSSGPCTGILPGVTYAPTAAQSLFIAGPGQSTNPTTAIGSLGGPPINITFASAQRAFGTDLFQNFGAGGQQAGNAAFTLAFLLNGGAVANYNVGVAPNGGSFFGLTGAIFNQVRIEQTDGFAVIDNVSFAPAIAAVPEPATWGMMLMGFGGLGYAMRRRRSTVARIRFA